MAYRTLEQENSFARSGDFAVGDGTASLYYDTASSHAAGAITISGGCGAGSGSGGAVSITAGQSSYSSYSRGARAITPLTRLYQPIYDKQEVSSESWARSNVRKIEFFQNPVIKSWKEEVQVRGSNGRFANKKILSHPQQRTYADTNMEHSGYLDQSYRVTGLGLMTPSSAKKANVLDFAEKSFLCFGVAGKEYLRLPVVMLLSEAGPAYTFVDAIDINPSEQFQVYIESKGLNLSSPFDIRCVLSGYYD